MIEKLISKLETFTIWRVIIETTILAFLVLFLLAKAIGVHNLDPLSASLITLKDFLFSLIEVVLALLFLLFLVSLVRWIKSDDGILIRPFEVDSNKENHNGQSISNLLIMDLQKIRQVHDWASKQKWAEPIDDSKNRKIDFLPVPITNYEKLDYNIFANLGTFNMGPLTVSFGHLLLLLKRLLGYPQSIITGTIQQRGLKICLKASMERKDTEVWEVRQDLGTREDENILRLVKDLALAIAKDKSRKKTHAKTLQGFKYFTEALEDYYRYTQTKQKSDLENSRIKCLIALKHELDYKQPAILLYILAVTALNDNNYKEAECLFRSSISFNPIADAFFGLGTVLHKLGKGEEAITNYDISIMMDPSKEYAWANKGNVLSDLKRYNEAIECYDRAIKLFNKAAEAPRFLAYSWYLRGLALYNSQHFRDAVESYGNAIEIDPTFEYAWANRGCAFHELGREFEAKKDYDKSVDYYTKALNSYDYAIKLKPSDTLSWYNRGIVLSKLGEIYCNVRKSYEMSTQFFEKAIKSYDSVLTVSVLITGVTNLSYPYIDALIDKGEAFRALGMIYSEINKSDDKAIEYYDEAIESCDRAICLDSKSQRAYLCKSLALNALHRDLDAEGALEKAKALGLKL